MDKNTYVSKSYTNSLSLGIVFGSMCYLCLFVSTRKRLQLLWWNF